MTLQQRLKKCLRDGNLRVADLARWFERPDPTVRSWVNGVKPSGGDLDLNDIGQRLLALERQIKRRQVFPFPPRLSPSERKQRVVDARTLLHNP